MEEGICNVNISKKRGKLVRGEVARAAITLALTWSGQADLQTVQHKVQDLVNLVNEQKTTLFSKFKHFAVKVRLYDESRV